MRHHLMSGRRHAFGRFQLTKNGFPAFATGLTEHRQPGQLVRRDGVIARQRVIGRRNQLETLGEQIPAIKPVPVIVQRPGNWMPPKF